MLEHASGVDNGGSGPYCVVSEEKLAPLSHVLQVSVLTTKLLDSLRQVFPFGVVKNCICIYMHIYVCMEKESNWCKRGRNMEKASPGLVCTVLAFEQLSPYLK